MVVDRAEVPLPNKRALAVKAETPVPPSETVKSVMPVIVPPVILTLLEFCPAMVPRPVTEVEAMEMEVLVTPVTLP